MIFPKFCEILPFLVLAVAGASGMIYNLGDSTFDDVVDNLPGDALLLVDFYTPSCRQCQRLSPVLDYLEDQWSREATDPDRRTFSLAKVDIETNPRLASVFRINKLPDLRFVREGLWRTYEGGRSIEDLQEFKERMALAPLPSVDAEELLELVSTRETVFVLSTEDGAPPASVAPGVLLAATMMQHVSTFRIASKEVLSSLGIDGSGTLPALLKVVAGQTERGGVVQPSFFEGDLASVSSSAVSRWVENESFGLVSDFTAVTFSRLSKLGRLMVMGIVDPRDDATPAFEKALRAVASGFGFKHADKTIFGIMDGTKLAGFVETFNIYDNLPRLVVLHVADDTFYTVDNMRLEAGEMEAFLVDVLLDREEAREAARKARREEKEAQRLKRE
eukprot:jgi/Undpi1/8868/HiC_scaffold_25.g11330.m1